MKHKLHKIKTDVGQVLVTAMNSDHAEWQATKFAADCGRSVRLANSQRVSVDPPRFALGSKAHAFIQRHGWPTGRRKKRR